METKLTLVMALLALFAASANAGDSKLTCVPDKSVVGQSVVCTCSGSAAGAKAVVWEFDGKTPSSGISGDSTLKEIYTRTVAIGDNTKKASCVWEHAGGADTKAEATFVVEAIAKPTIKCDPAKVDKDKKSKCTCSTTNTAATTKFTFSVDAAAAVDGTGTTKNEYEVTITKEAKVTCMAHFSATVKSAASDEAKIEMNDAAGGGSGSGAPGLPLAAMLFAFIATLFLRV